MPRCFYLTFLHTTLKISVRQHFQPNHMYAYWTMSSRNSYDCGEMKLAETINLVYLLRITLVQKCLVVAQVLVVDQFLLS